MAVMTTFLLSAGRCSRWNRYNQGSTIEPKDLITLTAPSTWSVTSSDPFGLKADAAKLRGKKSSESVETVEEEEEEDEDKDEDYRQQYYDPNAPYPQPGRPPAEGAVPWGAYPYQGQPGQPPLYNTTTYNINATSQIYTRSTNTSKGLNQTETAANIGYQYPQTYPQQSPQYFPPVPQYPYPVPQYPQQSPQYFPPVPLYPPHPVPQFPHPVPQSPQPVPQYPQPIHPQFPQGLQYPQSHHPPSIAHQNRSKVNATQSLVAGPVLGVKNESLTQDHHQPQVHHPPYYPQPHMPPVMGPYMYFPRFLFGQKTTPTTKIPKIVYKPINLTELLNAIKRENYNPLKMYICLKALKELEPPDALWVVVRNHVSPTVVYKTLRKIEVAPLVAYNLLNSWVDNLHYKSDIMERLKITTPIPTTTLSPYDETVDPVIYTLPTSLEHKIQDKFGNYTYRRVEATTMSPVLSTTTTTADRNVNGVNYATQPAMYTKQQSIQYDSITRIHPANTTEVSYAIRNLSRVVDTRIPVPRKTIAFNPRRMVTIPIKDIKQVVSNITVELAVNRSYSTRKMKDSEIVECIKLLEAEKAQNQRNHSVRYRKIQDNIYKLRKKVIDVHEGPKDMLRSLVCSKSVVDDWIKKHPKAYENIVKDYSGRFKKSVLRDVKRIAKQLTYTPPRRERLGRQNEGKGFSLPDNYEINKEKYEFLKNAARKTDNREKVGRRWGLAEKPPEYVEVRKGKYIQPRVQRKRYKDEKYDGTYIDTLTDRSEEGKRKEEKNDKEKTSDKEIENDKEKKNDKENDKEKQNDKKKKTDKEKKNGKKKESDKEKSKEKKNGKEKDSDKEKRKEKEKNKGIEKKKTEPEKKQKTKEEKKRKKDKDKNKKNSQMNEDKYYDDVYHSSIYESSGTSSSSVHFYEDSEKSDKPLFQKAYKAAMLHTEKAKLEKEAEEKKRIEEESKKKLEKTSSEERRAMRGKMLLERQEEVRKQKKEKEIKKQAKKKLKRIKRKKKNT